MRQVTWTKGPLVDVIAGGGISTVVVVGSSSVGEHVKPEMEQAFEDTLRALEKFESAAVRVREHREGATAT